VFKSNVATESELRKPFYEAESCHQNYMINNPTQLYVGLNEQPKIGNLKRLFSDSYRERAVLVTDNQRWIRRSLPPPTGTDIMTQIDKVLYAGKTHTSGGRGGASRISDGRLNIALSSPDTSGSGTNPEQLFAAGWSASFIGALGLAAGKMKIALPTDLAVDAEVDLGMTGDGISYRLA
jgi:hypothetical protein